MICVEEVIIDDTLNSSFVWSQEWNRCLSQHSDSRWIEDACERERWIGTHRDGNREELFECSSTSISLFSGRTVVSLGDEIGWSILRLSKCIWWIVVESRSNDLLHRMSSQWKTTNIDALFVDKTSNNRRQDQRDHWIVDQLSFRSSFLCSLFLCSSVTLSLFFAYIKNESDSRDIFLELER